MTLDNLNMIDILWMEHGELHLRIMDPINWEDDKDHLLTLSDKLLLYRLFIELKRYLPLIEEGTEINGFCVEYNSLGKIPLYVIKYLKQYEKHILPNNVRIKILSGGFVREPRYAKKIMHSVILSAGDFEVSRDKLLTAGDLSFENRTKYLDMKIRDHIKVVEEIKQAGKNDLRYKPLLCFEKLHGPLEPICDEPAWPEGYDGEEHDGTFSWDGEGEYDGEFNRTVYWSINLAQNFRDADKRIRQKKEKQ